jgi:hypothetical protein
LESQDYPILFRAGDATAIRAQKRHFLLVRTRIALLLVTAGIASFSWNQFPDVRIWAAISSAVFLVASIALSAVMEMRKFDRLWFSSRAIAESAKMESWKFMMNVEPYEGDDAAAEKAFLERLDELLRSQPSVLPEMVALLKEGAQITEQMKKMRTASLDDRLAYYVQNRIRDQRRWYAIKAAKNHSDESRWSIISWILQIGAAAIAIVVVGVSDPIIKPVGVLTTAGAGVLSWINARNVRELSQSYSLIAQQLTNLEALATQVSTEGKLGEIALDVERTISREHTIWLKRRLM